MSGKTLTKQITSLLLGVAAGDALGVPAEFRPRGSFHVTGMQGYGSHNQPPGTWSDDTSLALCLADSLSRGFNPADIARNFLLWYEHGVFTAHGNVFDIGRTTAKAIRNLKAGTAPEKAGGSNANENGNGGLMRIAPLVFYIAGKPEAERFAVTKTATAITHAHECSVAASFIYLEYLLRLLGGMEKTAAYAELRNGFRDGSPRVGDDTLSKFTRVLRDDIRALPKTSIRSGGFVIDTLEAAFWCFLTTDNYRDAVLKAVNLGDDTDTTAAVTGGLAGLYYGLDAIPSDWRETLAARADICRIAENMAAGLAA
jgi:ADP-ribosylglycohydrolase